MIVNELYFGQGLGNQLWNYAVARILAEKRHCDFSILGRERFKGVDFMDLDFGTELKGGSSPEGGPPTTLPNDIAHYYREQRENLRNTNVDISRTDSGLLDIEADTKFDGNCQSTKYLEGYRKNILQWIKVNDGYKNKHKTDEDTCVIHLRCGDFAGIKDVFLPPSYYKTAMEHVRKQNRNVTFVCVTDQPKTAKKILPGVEIVGSALESIEDENKASHHHGGPVGIDFCLLMNTKYLIIPNSSFSWWAAYLNTNKSMIIAPKYWARYNTSDGFWSTSDIITEGFTYLDKQGKLWTSRDCWLEKNAFEATHQDMFVMALQSDQKTVSIGHRVALPLKRGAQILRSGSKKLRDTVGGVRPPRHSRDEIAQYRKQIKIYDVFTFFNELELLEMRLRILDACVDYFVIIECTETFSGKPKSLIFEKNKHRFKKYLPKIIYYVTDDVPKDKDDLRKRLKNPKITDLDREIINNALTSDNVPEGQVHWFKEFYQKESIKKALTSLHDNDICFVGDVDEVWNPEAIIDFTQDNIFKLRQDVYAYYLNNRSNEPWAGTLVTKYKNIKNGCLNHMRTASKTNYTYIKNGGWHFTNQGGADRIRKKLESYGHQEFNNAEIKSDIENKMRENKDFVGRKFTFWTDEKNLPDYIRNNKAKYKTFFK